MYTLEIANMTCGHCAGRITQAVKTLDPDARIEIALETKRVRIESDTALAEIASALAEAGYPAIDAANQG